MSNPKINFNFISEVSLTYPRLGPNEILNEVLLKATLIKKDIAIYSRAQTTITSLLVCCTFLLASKFFVNLPKEIIAHLQDFKVR